VKAILEFNLPEEQDAHRHAINGGAYVAALAELDNLLRGDIKYNEGLPEDVAAKVREIRESLHSICAELDISVWD
jgi:hypothetical protein